MVPGSGMFTGFDMINPHILTILIVDDNDNNLQIAAQIIHKAGYQVILSSDGPHALELAREELPDAILLDIMMPGMDGLEVCRHLKASPSLCEIPVIFLTAKDEEISVEEGLGIGGIDFVVKPVSERILLARLRSHLERSLYFRQLEQMNQKLEETNQRLDAQIQKNLGILATINDQVRNPLSIAITLIEMSECEHGDEIIGHLNRIDSVIDDLDQGFIQSEKVLAYLKKHHGIS